MPYSATIWPAMIYPGGTNPTQTVFPTPTYDDDIVADTPSLFLPLDESSGAVAADLSGNGRDGAYGGATVQYSQASLVLDGSTAIGLLNAGNVSRAGALGAGTVAWSVEWWSKLVSFGTGGPGSILAYTGPLTGFIFIPDPAGGATYGSLADSKFLAGGTIALGTTYHWVATFDGAGTLRLYRDGALLAGPVAQIGVTGAWDILGLNNQAGDAESVFQKVAIYNYELTAAQVLAHYTSGTTTPSTPVATQPPLQYPQPTPQSIDWAPAAATPNQTTYVPWQETADAIRAEFDIQPPASTVNVNAVADTEE